jgi:hypothetical protein
MAASNVYNRQASVAEKDRRFRINKEALIIGPAVCQGLGHRNQISVRARTDETRDAAHGQRQVFFRLMVEPTL